jgi:pimeloyl-ACP methyl ester carboxylesterase
MLSYVDQGDRAAPALVLLPGLTDSWRSYELVLPHLPESVRAIAVSQRGHGDSDKPESGYRTQDFASDLLEFLDTLGLQDAVVAGHSSASLVVRRFAIDNPGRATGLVLEGSPFTLRGNRDMEAFVGSTLSSLRDPLDPDFVRGFAEGTTGQVSRSFMDAMVRESLKVPARVWREAFESLLRDDDTDELRHVAAPTLLIWGDRDTLVGRDQQDMLATEIPGSELLVYPGVGHTPHWEDPRRFAADLVAFVERVT